MLSMLLIAAIALAVSFGMRNFSLGDDGKVSVSTSKGEAGAGTAANAPGTVTQTVTSVSTLASEEAASSKVDRPSQSAGSSPSQPATTGSGSTSGGASSGEADAFVKTILDGHNDFRRKHDAADLVWNTTLQASAQKWAEHCVWEHSGGKVGPYGENLSAVVPFQKNDKFDPMSGISVWNGEEKDYDYSKPTGFTHETGHASFLSLAQRRYCSVTDNGASRRQQFTQVVWIGTQQIGCAFTTCEGFFGHPLGAFFVCEYWPGGNIVTDDLKYFKDNVKPP
ncbi:hypothetical protein BMF94_1680 [Rhodotorula taiwanensis]|uniref:SCP domain-containing protein n=1 Tax=Rhodotorula taiwanensis TaxID=741276 RepID=A0A2S5BEW6_9BASI|nr:hypothetical protein BMF94_1680 [Rhodotorula taiwanensis]